jgi:hypothetical protein
LTTAIYLVNHGEYSTTRRMNSMMMASPRVRAKVVRARASAKAALVRATTMTTRMMERARVALQERGVKIIALLAKLQL